MNATVGTSIIKKSLVWGCFALGLGVVIGAFGAHGLEKTVTGKYLATFKTGVTYQYYHGFALALIGLIASRFEQIQIGNAMRCFAAGILLFSGNCYLYALTQSKIFAMIVPIGGLFFILGWTFITMELHRKLK